MLQSIPAMEIIRGPGTGFDALVHLRPPSLALKWLPIIAAEHIGLTAALSQLLAADRKIYVRFILAYAASRSNCSTSDSC
jgi:hypothetical protein